MKRKSNLYKDIYLFNNILSAYNEVVKKSKSKDKKTYIYV